MSTSGSEGENEIQGKIEELDGSHRTLSREVSAIENNIDALIGQRESYYSQLASIYLPELDAKSIEHTLIQVQDRVRGVFKQKQNERTSLESAMENILNDKRNFETQLAGVTDLLRRKSGERDAIQQTINEEFAADKEYSALIAQIEEKGKELERNQKRLEEFKSEAQRKLKPYRDSELFMYLVDREFNGSKYSAGRLIKIWDSLVAKKINFSENLENYTFLLTMPERMKEVFDGKKSDYDVLLEKAEKVRKHVEDKHGLTEVLEAGEKLVGEREKLVAKISQKDKEYQNYSQRREEVDNTKGEYHKSALDEIKKFLEGDDISNLKKLARETPSSLDDCLVNKIEDAENKIAQLKTQVVNTKQKRDALSKKINGMQNILSKYRSNDYESGRSYFDSGLNFEMLLAGYLLGKHSSDHVWNEISNSQHFKPKPQPTYSPSYSGSGGFSSSSSSSSHHSSSSSSFGGFGGGGFSSRSSFGGGGFSTRGGF